MRRVVFSGGPGAGKTALLNELRSLGYATMGDSARSIIAERLRSNLSPRPEALKFANQVLDKDAQSYLGCTQPTDLVFYDRGVVDALCMLDQVAPLEERELETLLMRYAYHREVFVFPPWREIYRNDLERDQTFIEAERVHNRVTSWYRRCGYELIEVPKISVQRRMEYVLQVLGRAEA